MTTENDVAPTEEETSPPRKRLRDSFGGNVLVIAITTVIILAGVWVVNNLGKDDKAEGTMPKVSSTDVSSVELKGDTSGAAPEVGKAAPEFTTFATSGDPVTLSDMAGEPVWLVFGATWCSNCRAETPDIQEVQKQYGSKVKIVAIYVGESLSTVSGYSDRLKLDYTQVADQYTVVGSQYKVMGLPTHVFIDKTGKVSEIDVGSITKTAASKKLDALLGQ